MRKSMKYFIQKIVVFILVLTLMLPLLHPFKVKAYETLSKASWFDGSIFDIIFKETTLDLKLDTYINDLYIYSYDTYQDYNGEVKNTSVSYKLTGTTGKNVYIGNTNSSYAKQRDIRVYLENVTIGAGNSINVYSVFENSTNVVELINSSESTISNLILNEKANVVLNLESDLTINTLNLGINSSLTVNLNGYKLNIGSLNSGVGTLNLVGSGNVEVTNDLNVGYLTVDESTVNASNIYTTYDMTFINNASILTKDATTGQIASNGNITVNNSAVSNAVLFGYKTDASGIKNFNLDSATFSNINTIGAVNGTNAVVLLNGNSPISQTSNSNYSFDYPIVYNYNEAEINDGSFPTHYRVKFTGGLGNNPEVLGTTSNLIFNNGERTLPSYTVDGYAYSGWFVNGGDVKITALSNQYGNLTLSASLIAGGVLVNMNLGYTPTSYTNDAPLPNEETILEVEVDDTLTLTKPFRFGYIFAGWKITTGTGRVLDPNLTSYKIQLDDLNLISSTTYELKLVATWEANEFPIRFYLGSEVSVEYIEISVDSGNTWHNISTFALTNSSKMTLDSINGYITFNADCAYKETLEEYFNENFGWDYPLVRDNRTGDAQKRFVMWETTSLVALNKNSVYELKNGFVNMPSSGTLVAYQETLNNEPVIIRAKWGTMEFTITSPVVTGWNVLVNGNVVDLSSGSVVVTVGSTVSWRTSYSDALNFSLWKVTYREDGTGLEKSLNVKERPYTSGEFIYYDFVMPTADVNATYTASGIYIDLSLSDITFAKAIAYNYNTTRTGFWYKVDLSNTLMSPLFAKLKNGTYSNDWLNLSSGDIDSYFYEFDITQPVYITTNNIKTQNQLTIFQEMNIYLKNCYMVAKDAYSSDFNDWSLLNKGNNKFNNLSKYVQTSKPDAIAKANLSTYANILIDLTEEKTGTINIYIDGTNVIGCIAPNNVTQSQMYLTKVNIVSKTNSTIDKLYFGTIIGIFDAFFKNITVNEYSDFETEYPDNFKYLAYLYCSQSQNGNVTFDNSIVNVPNKSLHSSFGYVYVKNNTNATVHNLEYAYYANISGNSNIHVLGYVLTVYYTIQINSGSITIEDFCLTRGYSSGGYVQSGGVVICKGYAIEINNFNITGGRLIANAVVIGSSSTNLTSSVSSISGGTIIANQLINFPVRVFNSNTSSLEEEIQRGTGYSKDNVGNGDSDIFAGYFQPGSSSGSSSHGYMFQKIKIYLMGYYRTAGTIIISGKTYNQYDKSVKATDAENPMSEIISLITDSDGSYLGNASSVLTDSYLQEKVLKASEKFSENECWLFGNSSYNIEGTSQYRAMNFSHNTKVYAAGNITFYNDAILKDTTIVCYGNISGKNNLTFHSGTYIANEIGNIYNLTQTLSDNTISYKSTQLLGGTFTINRLGVLSETPYSVKSYSNVYVDSKVVFTKNVSLVNDYYINYAYNDTLYDVSSSNPEMIRFIGTLTPTNNTINSISLSLVSNLDTLEVATDSVHFISPLVKEDSEYGSWRFEYLNGSIIDNVNINGIFKNGTQSVDSANSYQRIVLYATKSMYNATVVEGLDYISSIKSNGSNLIINDSSVKINAESQVEITINDVNMSDKVIVWYFDDNNVLHNADPIINGNVITFTMPLANIEIFIADSITVYLDLYELGFTTDGFRIEYEKSSVDNDKDFIYKGDIIVKQSNITKTRYVSGSGSFLIRDSKDDNNYSVQSKYSTQNRIYFDSYSDSVLDINGKARKIILNEIIITGSDYSIFVAKNNKSLTIYLDGINGITALKSESGNNITLEGINGITKDYLSASCLSNRYVLYNVGTGTFEYKNVSLMFGHYGHLGRFDVRSGSTLKFTNVKYHTTYWYWYTWFSNNVEDVIMDKCDINIKTTRSTSAGLFANTKNVYINNSNFVFLSGGGTTTYHLLYGINEYINLNNSTFTWNLIPSETGSVVTQNLNDSYNAKGIKLENNSHLNVMQRLTTRELEVDNSTVTITNREANPGFLFCPKIVVRNNGVINSDNILVSGFYYPPTINDEGLGDDYFYNAAENNVFILDGSSYEGLTLNGGTLNVSGFIGGDVNSKITINSGTVNANKIGTIGYIYGYTTRIPMITEPYVLSYKKMVSADTRSTININGGTINLTENGYIGGLYSDINITGGLINLSDYSYLGLNAEQQNQVETYYDTLGKNPSNITSLNVTGGTIKTNGTLNNGSISLPYSTGTFSGVDTSFNVFSLTAHKGTLNISGKTDYSLTDILNDNPYVATLRKNEHDRVKYLVNNTLSAQHLNIYDEAVLYADKAYALAETGETGTFYVEDDGESTIYLNTTYGTLGNGDILFDAYTENTIEKPDCKNVYGLKTVYIKYVLDDLTGIIEDIHLNNVINNSPTYYTVGQTDVNGEYYLELVDANCFGYTFEGWFTNAECTGDPVTKILTTNQDDVTLYAKWSKKTVKFSVYIDNNVLTSKFVEELTNQTGIFNLTNDKFTYSYTQDVEYNTNLLLNIDLSKYKMESYQVIDIAIKDDYYKSGNQTIINSDQVITNELLQAYFDKVNSLGSGASIELRIYKIMNTRQKVTLDLNLDSNNKPKDASFVFGSIIPNESVNSVYFYVDLGLSLLTAESALGTDGELIKASAPGYTFQGWYTNKECTGEAVTKDFVITADSVNTFYAKWVANSYTIRFDALSGGVITKDNNEPTGSESQTIDGLINYDKVIDGNLDFDSAVNSSLPYAWKDGYMFTHWEYEVNGIKYKLDSEEFNIESISSLKINETISITFTAVYKEVEVTYNPNGGIWQSDITGSKNTSNNITIHDNYNEPLLGYTNNGGSIEIISTTASQFASNNYQYITNDYRENIKKTGYTFYGWFDEFGNEIKTFPRYNDVTVNAKWVANTYELILNSYDKNHDSTKYQHTSFVDDYNTGDAPIATVTVGNEIEGTYVINWPSRDTTSTWYAYNKNFSGTLTDDSKRFLLGFTFDALDPGASEGDGRTLYEKYAAQITNLYNQGFIFQKKEGTLDGSIFSLPENYEYGSSVIDGTHDVPDYPNGYFIPMYAVYREVSLVFIERIVVEDTVYETVMYTAPWSAYSTYPESYKKTSNVPSGYTLVGWYVNGYELSGFEKYPDDSATYDAKKQGFKNWASSKGIYDIRVYTIYAAQVTEKNKGLTADYNPTHTGTSYYQYKLPNSMLDGELNYSISNKTTGFNIVPLANIEYYNSSLANNTVAIVVELFKNGIKEYSFDLSESGLADSSYKIGSGWEIRLTLYHSKIMSETITHNFDLTFTFEGIDSQFIKFEQFAINLQPSMYNVHYNANLPAYDFLNVLNYQGFNNDPLNATKVISLGYNQLLYSSGDIPQVEGFTADGKWYLTDINGNEIINQSVNFGEEAIYDIKTLFTGTNYPEDIYVKTKWIINEHNFASNTDVRNEWNIKNNSNLIISDLTVITYHNLVTFTAVTSGNHPEFILIKIDGEIYRLSEYGSKNSDGVYVFYMPDADIEAVYEDIVTLFLDEGTISINTSSYTQNANTVIWPGGYIILMDENNMSDGEITYNTLIISGDLSTREFNVGNLYIGSNNSIELDVSTKVNINASYGGTISNIDIFNILVPSTSELVLNDSTVKLNPSVNYAGIGDYQGSGSITLNNVDIEAYVTAPSNASIIGSNSINGTSEDIIINDSNINVHEYSTPSAAYSGIWIGGKNSNIVTIDNSNINIESDSSRMTGPYVIYSDIVSIKDSILGTDINPLIDPIFANSELNIDNSKIYQHIYSILPSGITAELGTSNSGEINVSNSLVNIDVSITDLPQMYSGTLYINDASSSVVIFDYQIIDTNNGDIVITNSGITQNTVSHSHTSDYYIINSFDSSSNLTVESLLSTSTIEVNDIKLDKITINSDAQIQLNNKLITEEVEIADSALLSVTSKVDENEISFASQNPFNASSLGKYYQNGGKISMTGVTNTIVGNDEMSIEIENVIATIHSLYAKELKVVDSTINANTTSGKVGSLGYTLNTPTYVELLGNSTINAYIIGAIGEHNESFTFVSIDDSVSYSGTLYQDWYRLAYDFNDSNFDLSNLPVVFRTSKVNGGEFISIPTIPANPTYNGVGTSYFSNWYFIDENGVYVALSTSNVEGFTKNVNSLLRTFSMYGTDNTDNTKTLVLHGWLLIRGTGVITSGRLFNEFTSTLSYISIFSDDSWSTLFNVEGALVEGSDYQLILGKKLPVGTKLTLVVLNNGQPKYYYYNVTTSVDKLTISSFIKMGTNNVSPDLLKGVAGSEINDTFIISADFSDVEDMSSYNNFDISLTLQLIFGSTIFDISALSYKTIPAPITSITQDEITGGIETIEGEITIEPGIDERLNDKEIVLIAELQNENYNSYDEISYNSNAIVIINDKEYEGIWLNNNKVAFIIETYNSEQVDTINASYIISGLNSGLYNITWNVSITNHNTNATNDIVALDKSDNVVNVIKEDVEEIVVNLVTVNGQVEEDNIFESTNTLDFVFSTRNNINNLSAQLEIITENGNSYLVDLDILVATSNNMFNIIIDFDSLQLDSIEGVYQIVFSIDGFDNSSSTSDDITYKFVVIE